jgi:hypothetical protein
MDEKKLRLHAVPLVSGLALSAKPCPDLPPVLSKTPLHLSPSLRCHFHAHPLVLLDYFISTSAPSRRRPPPNNRLTSPGSMCSPGRAASLSPIVQDVQNTLSIDPVVCPRCNPLLKCGQLETIRLVRPQQCSPDLSGARSRVISWA